MLIDDFDGTTISGTATTTHFSLNHVAYEIDLGPENLQKLKDALAPFIKAGRRASTSEPTARSSARTTPASRRGRGTHSNGARDVTAIREWAKANGFEIGDRGRIPAQVLEAYAALGASAGSTPGA